jgi:branched-chain amino acid transport system substrate-binding protein
VQDFIHAYESKYGLVPESVAVLRIRSDVSDRRCNPPCRVGQAGRYRGCAETTRMPSLLGGTYAMDDHNHSHMPLQITGLRNARPTVIGAGG